MNPELTEDQGILLKTTRRFLEQETPLTSVRALADDPVGFDPAWWRRGAALGWTSALVPESLGGGTVSGNGIADLVLVAETMGAMVAPGPLLPVNVVAEAVASAGSAAQQADVLPGLLSGDEVSAWAFAEPGGSWDPTGVHLRAEPLSGGGFALHGEKAYVEAGAQAAVLLVTARTDAGLTQFLVRSNAPGVTVTPVPALDLVRRFARVSFDTTVPEGAVLGEVGGADEAVERQLQVALVLQCAEMVGAIDRVFDRTVQWAFDRYSFGRPLASYQALKHRFADMKMWLEACHATATAAASAVGANAPDAGELARVAKAYIGERAPEIVQDCVQLHGGIGVTWEHDLHLYLRRVTLDRALYGSPADLLQEIAVMLGM